MIKIRLLTKKKLESKSFSISIRDLGIIDVNYKKWGYDSRSECIREILVNILKKEQIKLEVEASDAN